MDRSLSARALLRLAVAAAVAGGLLAGCRDSSPSTEPTTVPGSTTSLTVDAADDIDYHQVGAPTVLTTGVLNRASPDGSTLFVEAVDPELSKPGCEGQPEPVMFRIPVAGGPREAVLVDGAPIRGRVIRGPGGRVALVKGCEEFVSELRVGTEAADGTLRDLRDVPLFREQGSLSGFGWSADGQRLLAGRNNLTQETPSDVVALDPVTGEVTYLFSPDGPAATAINAVAQLADGTYVVAGFGEVSLRDATGTAIARANGFEFVVGDGALVAVIGPGITVLGPGTPQHVVPERPGSAILAAAFSPDSAALVYTVGTDGVESVAVTTIADARTTTVDNPPGRYFRTIFTGDGRAIAFNRQPSSDVDPGDDPEVVVARLGD